MLPGRAMNNPTGASGGWDGDTGWEEVGMEVGMEANGRAAVMGKARICHTVTDTPGPRAAQCAGTLGNHTIISGAANADTEHTTNVS